MIYRPSQRVPSATAEVHIWHAVLGRCAVFWYHMTSFALRLFRPAGTTCLSQSWLWYSTVCLPMDIWPLRAVGSRWAHAVRSVTAFELSVQADRHKLRANLSAIYRHHQRNYPLAHFVLRLSEIMSFCQAARLLLMVTKLVSVSSTAGVQHRLDPSKM